MVKRLLLTSAFVILGALPLAAAPITITYTFTGSPGNQASEPADAQPANATASDIIRGAGLTPVAGANSINSSAWSQDGFADLSDNDYYEFSITPDAGFEMDLDLL